MQDYRKLQIWQEGIAIVKLSYSLCNDLPKEEQFGIISQIKRASVSIPANIAEGASRKSTKDFYRFLEIALGAAFELETDFIIVKELNLLKTKANTLDELMGKVDAIKKMIYSFMGKMQ